MLRRSLLLAAALLALLLAGITTAQTPQIVGPETYPEGINPLTGLPVADPALLNRRPLLVKVSDYPPIVRPQSGLMSADIVWEHLLAGGVTRFSAIFLGSDVAPVGPIRSGRLVDFELTRIYRSLFVYSGMAEGAVNILRGDPVVSSRAIGGIDPCPALCRIPRDGVALEHTLFGDTAALRELAVARRRNVTPERVYGMAFSDQPPAGRAVDGLTVSYRASQIVWRYDSASGRWMRWQDNEPHLDALTGQQLSAANVLVLEEIHTEQPFVREGYWGPGDFAFSVNFIGEGRVFLLRDGQYTEGVWRRASRDEPLTYFDLAGNPLPFKPGNTFINLVPRWIDGYYLTFALRDAPQVKVIGSIGQAIRTGPGGLYRSPDVAYPGDTFSAVGRNRAGDWLQLLRPEYVNGEALWLPVTALDTSGLDISALPLSRPTNER